MGAFAGTVTTLRRWEDADRNGKSIQQWCKDVSIVLATQGGATNTIGKTALGFSSIYTVQLISFTDGSAQIRAVWLFTDGTSVFVGDPTNATDATRGIPGDVTGTLVFRICGKPV